DWRADLRAIACSTRDTLHRHQWAVNFMGGRPPLGPKSLRNLERALSVFDGLDLDKGTAMTTLTAVNTYVLGAVLRELQEMNAEHYMAEVFAGLSEPEKQALIREFTERIRGAGQFPHLVAMLAEGIDPDAPETRDERFEFGLDCLLDGIVARLPPAARPPPPACPAGPLAARHASAQVRAASGRADAPARTRGGHQAIGGVRRVAPPGQQALFRARSALRGHGGMWPVGGPDGGGRTDAHPFLGRVGLLAVHRDVADLQFGVGHPQLHEQPDAPEDEEGDQRVPDDDGQRGAGLDQQLVRVPVEQARGRDVG